MFHSLCFSLTITPIPLSTIFSLCFHPFRTLLRTVLLSPSPLTRLPAPCLQFSTTSLTKAYFFFPKILFSYPCEIQTDGVKSSGRTKHLPFNSIYLRTLCSLNSKRLSRAPLRRWLCPQLCSGASAVLFCRYTPSSRQANQEEGKEWLRSHSTGGLQDTGSPSPLVSPSAMSTSATGKYHFSNLGKIVQNNILTSFLSPPTLTGAPVSLPKIVLLKRR